jgi:hypothetical protein
MLNIEYQQERTNFLFIRATLAKITFPKSDIPSPK